MTCQHNYAQYQMEDAKILKIKNDWLKRKFYIAEEQLTNEHRQ